MKRFSLAILGLCAGMVPATAQYYEYPPRRNSYDPPRYSYEPAPRQSYRQYYQQDPYGWDDRPRYRPPVIGNVCYTSRGSCRTRPAPEQSSCACNIPGFGLKRGGVIAQPQW
jgi:hypothetical protein